MRIFKNINKAGKCFICNTNEDGECCLIGVAGTSKDNTMQAEQAHIKCLDLFYYKDKKIIAQSIK